MITFVYAYYDNKKMLEKHVEEWLQYPVGIQFIIVDDASPNSPARDILKHVDLPLELYRVEQNIPWNQNGARNLAMMQCKSDWALMLDMDHFLPVKEATKAMAMRKHSGFYYVPRRVLPDGSSHKPHPNTFMLERQKFWECGGYDEDFCGYYGSDKIFRLALDTVAERVETESFKTVLYEGVIKDANTREWGRKDSEYHSANHKHLREKRKAAPYKAKDHIRFNWERVL